MPLILWLTAAYYVLGRLSLPLAIPPGFASSVWPAAGVALIAVLLAGRRVWPGVALGSFLITAFTTFDGLGGAELLRAAALAAAIGGGATLQALAGAYAIGRWVGLPHSLSDSRNIFRVLLLGGPVSCLVSATVGVASLVASTAIDPSHAAFHWWTWWVGDTIGVLVVAPLALAFVGEGHGTSLHWRRRVFAPLVVAAAAVVMIFFYSRNQERHRFELELSQRALSLAHTFEKYTDRSLDGLVSIEGLFAASQLVSRQEFRRFAERLLERNPTFQALSWNPWVPQRERPFYEAAGRADGLATYQFTEAVSGRLQPAAERSYYVVVHYIEPYAGNERALGFDIASDPSRLAALLSARDSGRAAATPGIRLVQETGEQTGVLILMPVYAGGTLPATVAERRRALSGYATAVLRVGDALRAALADLPDAGFAVRLVDRSAPLQPVLMAALPGDDGPAGPEDLSWSFERDVGGRTWSLEFAPTPGSLASHRSWSVWLVLVGGLFLVSLLGALLLVQNARATEMALLNTQLEEGMQRRLRLEKRRKRLIDELELRNAELERFSYTVTHDLKSPLITFKGYLGLLEKDLAAGRQAEVEAEISQLHSTADRMRELVADLLELSRAGRAAGPAETLCIGEIAREAVAQLSGSPVAATVRIDVAPDLPRVTANRGQLLEVLQNLLDNAIKFMGDRDDPRIEIGATVQGDRVVCHVRDNGIGLHPAHHERIFGLFNRLDATLDGTGIGLALVRRIVETSGGSAWVESAGEGQGSTFFFTLPAA